MAERPAILSAKVDKLLAIIEDGNTAKRNPPGNAVADDVRAAQAEAVSEAASAKGSVAAIESIKLPSERFEQ